MENSMLIFIIAVLWMTLAALVIIQYAPYCNELTFIQQLIVCIIFILIGPIILFSSIFEVLLDCFMPEGWNDNDDIYKH